MSEYMSLNSMLSIELASHQLIPEYFNSYISYMGRIFNFTFPKQMDLITQCPSVQRELCDISPDIAIRCLWAAISI